MSRNKATALLPKLGSFACRHCMFKVEHVLGHPSFDPSVSGKSLMIKIERMVVRLRLFTAASARQQA